MNVFGVKEGRAIALNEENFEAKTEHQAPYQQMVPNRGWHYYAICPECGNPVQIINLYTAEMRQNKTGKIVTYAQHTRGPINGFQNWNEQEKQNCSLYHPSKLGNTRVLHNDQHSIELRDFMNQHRTEICRDIQRVFGINFSSDLMEKLWEEFMTSEAYTYRAVTHFNLPYAIMRYQPAFSLFSQYLRDNDVGHSIRDDIERNSQYFEVNKDRKVIKKDSVKDWAEIQFFLSNHRNVGGKDTIRLRIDEKMSNSPRHRIVDLTIKIALFNY